jgi:hypothetical protein
LLATASIGRQPFCVLCDTLDLQRWGVARSLSVALNWVPAGPSTGSMQPEQASVAAKSVTSSVGYAIGFMS